MASTTAPTKQIIMSDMFSNENTVGFRRFKVQTLNLAQSYIVDGLGQYLEWYEPSIDVGEENSAYARVIVPSGFYMALDYRLLVTEKEMKAQALKLCS